MLTPVPFDTPFNKRYPDAPLGGDTRECEAIFGLAELLYKGARGDPK